jgi:hypothetical protein
MEDGTSSIQEQENQKKFRKMSSLSKDGIVAVEPIIAKDK